MRNEKKIAKCDAACWYCGAKLVWQSDSNYDEVFEEGDGIVTFLTCSGCGADVMYSLSDSKKVQKQGIFKKLKNSFRKKFFRHT